MTPGLAATSPWRPGSAMRPRAARAASARSDTQPLPLGIVEGGTADLDRDVAVAQEIDRAHRLAIALGPARQQPEADEVSKCRRISDRGDIALIIRRGRRRAFRNEMRAGHEAVV